MSSIIINADLCKVYEGDTRAQREMLGLRRGMGDKSRWGPARPS